MYEQYFGLIAKPFAITPDPRFLYLSERYHDALAHLIYGIREGDGFVQFTGEVGTGKTTLCRYLLERIDENVHIALILNPRLTVVELLQTICDEFALPYPEQGSVKAYVDILYSFLLEKHAAGERVVVILDEAQNLDIAVLEQLRLLTNLETKEQKLLQIILIGQPELRLLLDKPDLRQLAQRITARYHLNALEKKEVGQYIQHRLLVAGAKRVLFSPAAVGRIAEFSRNIPRLINVLANRSLLIAYTKERLQVTPAMVEQAARELYLRRPPRPLRWGLLSVLVLLLAVWVSSLFMPLSFWPETRLSLPKAPVEAGAEALAADAPVLMPIEQTPQPVMPAVVPNAVAVLPTETTLENAPLVLPLAQLFRGSPTETPLALLQALVRYWEVPVPMAADLDVLCQALPDVGLRCARFAPSALSPTLLQQLNRPALLWVDETQTPLLLLRLRNTATGQLLAEVGRLLPGETVLGRQFVAFSEITALWNGQAIVLWRPPLIFGGRLPSVRLGDSGEQVLWLRARLREAGLPVALDNRRFDQALADTVRDFQRRYGLLSDGVVGQNTLIQLQNVIDPASEKRLIEE
jgi:general secretion pathway protein A